MNIYNRKTKEYEETAQYGGSLLEILYNHVVGRVLLKVVIHPIFSRIYGGYNNSSFSKGRIEPFAQKYGISPEDYEKRDYASFNDFFSRRIKTGRRPVDMCPGSLVAPADSKLLVYPIREDSLIRVKGVDYTLQELVADRVDMHSYAGGYCLVFRLAMDDYHRYAFVDHGNVQQSFSIKGRLHTVSSLSAGHKVYRENSRVVNVLDTENFGQLIYIEVGALLVGRIVNHPIQSFQKGMEKGYFQLGGSTIILLLQKDCIHLDEDIIRVCDDGVEVKVQLGEKIGSK